MKDGSSLVVTPSSIPSLATCGPDVDLSSEGSEDILEDLEDEPVLKKRIYDFDDKVLPSRSNSRVCAFFPSPPPHFLSSLPYTYVFASPLCCNLPLFVCLFPCFAETFEGPRVIADVGMPPAAAPATPIAPVSAIPTTPVSAIPSIPVSAVPTTSILTSPGEFLISFLVSFLLVNYSWLMLCLMLLV